MLPVVLSLLASSFVIAVVLTPVVRRLGSRQGLLDSSGAAGHAKVLRRVPNIGGVAIALAILLPMTVGLFGAWVAADALTTPFPDLAAHLAGIRQETPLALTVMGGVLLLHILGVIDDRRALGPWLKLALMAAPALALTLFFDVRLLSLLATWLGPPGALLSILLTLAWFIVVTNAINFMDNMDGLAAGTSAVAGALFMTTALLNGQWFVAMTLALLVGASLGFLLYNRPKASIFMGDGGSLVLGFLLAFLTAHSTYAGIGADSMPVPGRATGAWYALFMPLCVLAVPLYDFTSIVIIRLSQGKNPMVGDQQHFSHRLRDRGLSDMQVLIVVTGVSAVTGIGGVLLARALPWQAALIGVQVLIALGLLALYEHGSRRRNAAP